MKAHPPSRAGSDPAGAAWPEQTRVGELGFWWRSVGGAGQTRRPLSGPLEVENALLEHPAVQACAVIGSPDTERGEVVKAFVVLREGTVPRDGLVRELQDHVKSITAPYKYPRAIEFIDQLPMTLTGKIRRRALRDRNHAQG